MWALGKGHRIIGEITFSERIMIAEGPTSSPIVSVRELDGYTIAKTTSGTTLIFREREDHRPSLRGGINMRRLRRALRKEAALGS